MKKLVALLIVVCLVFAVALSVPAIKDKRAENKAPSAPAADSAEPVEGIDFAAIYATHDPNEVVAEINGSSVTWGDYFTWFVINARQVENYFSQMEAYYGVTMTWNDDMGNGSTYIDALPELIEDNMRQYYAIEAVAAKAGVQRDAAYEEYMKAALSNDIVSTCGEGASVEDFYAFLSEQYFTMNVYNMLNAAQYFNNAAVDVLYGETADKVSDEDALGYLSDNGYLYYANHILLRNTDSQGNALDEAALAANAEKLNAVVEEIRAIEDPAERQARFEEIKAEMDEDTGKAMYPSGYTFRSGEMVPEFEAAAAALGEYEISDIVETDYGYHILLRMPLSGDSYLDTNGNTARHLWASADFTARVEETCNSLPFSFVNGFEGVDLAAYVG